MQSAQPPATYRHRSSRRRTPVSIASSAEHAASKARPIRQITGSGVFGCTIDVAEATLLEVAQLIAEETGGKAPRRATPLWVLRGIGWGSDLASRVTGKEPDLTPELVRQLSFSVWADVSKAVEELGYEVVPGHAGPWGPTGTSREDVGAPILNLSCQGALRV